MGIVFPLTLVFVIPFIFGVMSLHRMSSRPSRQFTIRGMMMFIFLWAVCLSQLSCLDVKRTGPNPVWQHDWIVPFAWVVLAVFYWRSRQFAVLLFHSTGILLVGYMSVIAFIRGDWQHRRWEGVEGFLGFSMIISSFYALLFFSLMMLLAILRRPVSTRQQKEDHQP
jgi:hypothetical protein